MNPSPYSHVEPETTADIWRWRSGFIATTVVLVILTWLLLRDPSIGFRGVSLLLVMWVLLGWASFFAATNAYGHPARHPRPDLALARGIPAWVFFLVGSGILLLVAVAWFLWADYRTAATLVGCAFGYLCVAYPRRLTIRRAALAGLALVIIAIGQLLL